MDFILANKGLADMQRRRLLAAHYPELDEPDGDLSWERWLEGIERLETALLLAPD